ncbi:CIA30 family protein [Pseudosulfitobacter pseudonitzschiae]|nr:CIA30 family protein [Pseudosulfitobacter pseudonitzschiae]
MRPGYGHPLCNLKAAQAAITYKQPFFPTCYGGGFIQMAFDLAEDAGGWTGLELDVYGNDERYDLRLRTTRLTRAWQSFRTEFVATAAWTTIKVPFDALEAYRTDASFDASELRRVGVVAVGREFAVDVAVSGVRLY